ncbi:MAG: fibronectin type III domain-containing protein [Solirubrobacteraceae bacterium]
MNKALCRLVLLSCVTVASIASAGVGSASAACSLRPLAVTSPATAISANSATLSGSVNPEGCATTYSFEYGTTTNYGQTTAGVDAGAGTAAVTAANPVTGLAPNTTYHFRVDATSAAGTTLGHDLTFKTITACVAGGGATPPTAVTSPAAAITATSATLAGKVDPHGCATTYTFEYGLTAAYGHMTAAASAGAATGSVAVTSAVIGLAPNTTYHFRIDATNAAGTSPGSDVAFMTSTACVAGGATAPSAVTAAPTAITASSATLRGSVDPHGCATTYTFEYGTTIAYGHATTASSAGAGTGAVAAASAVTGLDPNTVYHLRIDATSAAGTTVGRDVAFATETACVRGSKPAVATEAAAGISPTGATLQGLVDPRGCATTYRFEYGTTAAYGQLTPLIAAGSGTTTVPEAAALTGLAPTTVYHYRIVAADAAGTTVGHDVAFATRPLPPPPPPPPSRVAIIGRRTPVARGYVAVIRLRCFGGSLSCTGAIRLIRHNRLLAAGTFSLAPNSTTTVAVPLNVRGRRLMRAHRRLFAQVVARSSTNRAARFTRLVRQFPVR